MVVWLPSTKPGMSLINVAWLSRCCPLIPVRHNFLRRFRHAAQAVAKSDHPNVIKNYERDEAYQAQDRRNS